MSEFFCGLLQLVFISNVVSANLVCREGHVEIVNKKATSLSVSSHISAAGTETLYGQSRCKLMFSLSAQGLCITNITFVIPDEILRASSPEL